MRYILIAYYKTYLHYYKIFNFVIYETLRLGGIIFFCLRQKMNLYAHVV